MALLDHPSTRPLLAAATGALCLSLAACGGGGGSTTVSGGTTSDSTTPATTSATTVPPTTTTSPSTSSSSSSSNAAADFKAGQCYDDTTSWSLVACTQPHKLEITAVVNTTKDAGDIVKRGVLRNWTCNNVLPGYLGSNSAGFSRILGQPVPTVVDTGSAKHIVCAAALAKADDSGYEQISYRLHNRVKDKGYLPYRICTSDRPSKVDSPKIVPCTQPHKSETIGGYVIGKPDGKYPGSAPTDRLALSKCTPLAKTYLGTVRSDVIAASNHTGAPGWKQGTTLTACFVEVTTGTVMKPLKGMKNQPLSKFR